MFCQNQIIHTIQPGDTLYRLAIIYGTTVPTLLALNPGVDIYNLQIGSGLVICPCVQFPPAKPMPPIGEIPAPDLSKLMRKLWSQHVYWTRMVLLSIAHRLPDQDATTARLLQNPKDLGALFGRYFGPEAAKTISDLLTEHLEIGAKIMTALRDKKPMEAEALTRQWYANADRMAEAFSRIYPNYNREELRKMLYEHLKLTTDEVAMRLAGNFAADIAAFDKVEKEALDMADYFTAGLVNK